MSSMGKPSLPLGAVRTEDGAVVVPESRRADGSVRKAIRIRQGYVPQDEVPKYKPIGQRLREQESNAKEAASAAPSTVDATAVAAALGSLSLDRDKTPSTRTTNDHGRQYDSRGKPQSDNASAASTDALTTTSTTRELKTELSALNKSLREITKLESFAAAYERGDEGARPLTDAQKRKAQRKPTLESRRADIIKLLDSEPKQARGQLGQQTHPTTRRHIEL